jgi:sugar lactone lactonase YvrE
MTKTTDVLLDGLAFPEGPRWRDGKLWFSDMHDQCVRTVDLDGRSEVVVRVENDPSGSAGCPTAGCSSFRCAIGALLRLDPDGLREVADLSKIAPFHCNDMVTDARGRSYVGNFGFDFTTGEKPRPTVLALVAPNGDVRVVAKRWRSRTAP